MNKEKCGYATSTATRGAGRGETLKSLLLKSVELARQEAGKNRVILSKGRNASYP